MTDIWQDSSLSLGERCVAFAENEMTNNVGEDAPGSYTSARLREYFSICTRNVNGKEVSLSSFKAGNWCAAGASFCLYKSLLPGETAPHWFRLGVIEIVADLQHNGLYHPVADVRNNIYQIKKGDVIIFDRSNPADLSTSWYRHIGRVHSLMDAGTFKCISGNSGGKWNVATCKLSQANILGFGEYPALNQRIFPITPEVTDLSNIDITSLAPSVDTGKDLAINNVIDIFQNELG